MSEPNNTPKVSSKKEKMKCRGCIHFFYNSNEGTVLGRTGKSWGLIIIFYIIYYCMLAGFWLGMIAVFMYGFMKESVPWRTGENSILTFSAGANAYPRLSIESGMIIISTDKTDMYYANYKINANDFLNKTMNGTSENSVECKSEQDQPSDVSKFCRYTLEDLGPCRYPVSQMDQRKLCVFIRVNKIFGWLPKIKNMSLTKDILIDCEGQNVGDVFNLGQPKYYPSFPDGAKTYGKISNKYFPFINQKGYVSPMIAVQFPEMKINTVILMQCQIQNVINSFKSIKFEIMVLDKKV